jgi:predicted nucleic-acid-binding Zn-ribbon protein
MSDELKWDGGCPKCASEDYEGHVVDEVGDVAVGPYNVFTCENCGYEWYDHT